MLTRPRFFTRHEDAEVCLLSLEFLIGCFLSLQRHHREFWGFLFVFWWWLSPLFLAVVALMSLRPQGCQAYGLKLRVNFSLERF